jgi:peptidoglycan/xylan/chitin deacetylase (PgdA/CDA1 family)
MKYLKNICPIKLILITVVAVTALSVQICCASAGQTIICFRCDDIYYSNDEGNKNFETVKSLVAIFTKNNTPITLGITPDAHFSFYYGTVPLLRGNKKITDNGSKIPDGFFYRNSQVAALLRSELSNKNIEIALHGYNHLKNNVSKDSEWIGLTGKEQDERISKALKILKDALDTTDIATFIPPWNSFDLNTLATLKSHRFNYLSGDVGVVKGRAFGTRSDSQKNYYDISMVPSTCSLSELESVINIAKSSGEGSIIVVTMHPYDFVEYGGKGVVSLKMLEDIMKKVTSDNQLEFSRIRDINKSILNSSRYSVSCRYHLLLKLAKKIFPRSVLLKCGFVDPNSGHWLENGRYLNEKQYVQLFNRILLLLSVVSVLIGGVIGYVFYRVIPKSVSLFSTALLFMSFSLPLLIALEYFKEIVTAPNMFGLLILYVIFIVSIFTTFLSLKLKTKSG